MNQITTFDKPEYLEDLIPLSDVPDYSSSHTANYNIFKYQNGNEIILHKLYRKNAKIYMEITEAYSLINQND